MHIETTSRCTLFCPACPRTWFGEKFNQSFPKQDLDLDVLDRFLDCESGSTVTRFMLNGNHGDPIYYPELLNLIDRFRLGRSFRICTNGSYQTEEFWENLGTRLTEKDTVFFSIDGLQHNNHLYRRNSNWESIMKGLDIMTKSKAKIVWKTIIFSYNETEIDKIKEFAESKNTIFVVDTSSRFEDQSLMPTDTSLIDTSRLYQHTQNIDVLEPKCVEAEYISADGYYWPCCFITSYFTLHKTTLWKNRQDWSLSTQNLDHARKRLFAWKQAILDDPKNAHPVCKMSCKPGQSSFVWSNI